VTTPTPDALGAAAAADQPRPPPEAEADAGPGADASAVRVAGRIAAREPVAYAIAWSTWVLFHTVPVFTGLLLRVVLDRAPVDGDDGVWLALAALAGVELGRWAMFVFDVVQWHGCWSFWATLPRVNVLRSLVGAPGPVAGRLPASSGEAVSRFRDDSLNVGLALDVWLDISGALVAAGFALALMVEVDARITLVVALPALVALWGCRWLGHRLRAWRRREREATARVTGFIGDAFGAVGTVKAAGARDAVARRFAQLGDERAEAARVDQVATQVLQTMSTAVGNLGTGLVLVLLVPALARGDASVGDVGLYATAVVALARLPWWAARFSATMRQAEVSVERLGELHDEGPAGIAAPAATHLRHGPGPFPPAPAGAGAADRLERLEARGLTVGRRLVDVDVVVERGSLTVVTGPVGSGKSTLLRALLGLLGRDAGEVLWNGAPVDDPGAVLVPPRAAYVAQAPRLFSEPLGDAILLGVDPGGLDAAVRLACLDEDVERMPEGLGTVVGARGVRLSGGQVQRTAAARALVRRPELLVVDDLSSALDVRTEARLWRQLLDDEAFRDAALLVVSHRPAVLERADRVVVLDGGRPVPSPA
jgi:ATP-binding cassette subfamily B protein